MDDHIDLGPVTVDELHRASTWLRTLAHRSSDHGQQIVWMVTDAAAESIADAVDMMEGSDSDVS
ncbi:hypothetical protein [Oleiagrimonas soli]|uniref:Uncharacterized protein n=1 Tax=Oleiagrimonas soli TaxID=1543381 RepID=A0A841KKU3_9GAMM|nr:hypothetical protein [Oleiagrimonas soli]MBB6183281.1 hypothetical protein [Oleiagrimonas soli]